MPLRLLRAGARLQAVHPGGVTRLHTPLHILGQLRRFSVFLCRTVALGAGQGHLGCGFANLTRQLESFRPLLPCHCESICSDLDLGRTAHTGVPKRYRDFSLVFALARVSTEHIGAMGQAHRCRARAKSLCSACACL